ncbi:MAG: GDP-mannose 6-dehydrogenase [Chroococcidiopsis cubana SAG 39.79]|jgi:GDP-mannose 6-dehydrogenase|uniref:UDP-glucose 6-dehydrogenase n=2 Tax=Chroococcidiopsis TaxID=54298 RepID=K9TUQ6_CHRTP|nr:MULTISPECIES: nucleotide sugar dehydrogenase [Chroococcidiopsis]PSB46059.1 nucleotide sugar dehydrogenase [Cyanosarcina cf. burmensis CCALA 770]AFY86265.1 nucleotide sugar dehydrogenase [Chroococcidiopsis thermalis PCC 7203]MDZ4873508.1 GDP-mannose 6-dehydrogenase [Chroococcidiopsis cubana SAG 39.79]RUT11697.1 GDP-mannose 6-dehydrogenase [Chroococcidiopsis cubana SAG 39.79]URD51122.1 nucleotide sugar dehydrogenase [Chroococcidiopsis sp. CCNUC1]
MRVIVWGLGYVGTVVAACLAQAGHDVIGVELNPEKVKVFNSGRSPLKEPDLDELIQQGIAQGRLRAVTDGEQYVAEADASLICVGTPSMADGSPMLNYIKGVAQQIGSGLKHSQRYHVVVLRSTVFPGVTRDFLLPLLEQHSLRSAGEDFGLVVNPEFLRETEAVTDFHAPPYTVIGELDKRSGDAIAQLYSNIQAPLHRVALEEAELLKVVNNTFHALKIGFSNEIGRICDRLGIDSHVLMQLVCADTKLNISPAYLKPGFAFGGSCLPKDLRSLIFNARQLGVEIPILDSVLPSNTLQVEAARIKIHETGAKHVGILGLSFKAGTDDLRESPVISLIRQLWQDGLEISVYDPDVNLEVLLGSNLEYLQRQLPQIDRILRTDIDSVLNECQTLVITQKRPEFTNIQGLKSHVAVLDLVRLSNESAVTGLANYEGISWQKKQPAKKILPFAGSDRANNKDVAPVAR